MSAGTPNTADWLAGYEAAKEQLAAELEAAAAHSLDEVRREVRLRCAKVARGMVPRMEALNGQ